MTALLLATLLAAGTATSPVKRAVFATIEKIFDSSFERTGGDDPLMVLGNTRGLYLQGYGAVFTTEVNLINSPSISPFRQTMPRDLIERVHQRKLRQVPLLRQTMREMLLHSARTLEAVPLDEQIVVGVSLFYFSWEDTGGLPAQLVMRAPRGKLLQKSGAESAILTEEN